jgi:D-sedoheptulose 7-phosphate isomerase
MALESTGIESWDGPTLNMSFASRPHTAAWDHLGELAAVLRRVPFRPVAEAVDILLEARARGRRVYVMGNGGSAATASHLVNDLVKTCRVDGYEPLKAFALSDNIALITAWANDAGYEFVFAEQIAAFCGPEDVVIAISASGNSPNIVNGLKAAAARGARTIALVGFDGGTASQLADVTIHVQCHDYGLVEDVHGAIGHAWTAAIQQALLSHGEG